MTDEHDRDCKKTLGQRLAKRAARVPTSAFGRMRRTAGTALRTALATVGRDGDGIAGLDADAIEALVESLGELKGIAMKMGQILSYIDDTLPPETRRILALLQVWSQPMPWDEVQAILRHELGARGDELIAAMDPVPVASASIGQVHRARPEAEDMAVKIRHTGIEDAIRADFRAARAGVAMARLFFPGGDVKELITEAKERFLEECDYENEARNQQGFAALYAGDPDLIVPAVHPAWCTRRVLATTWHTGAGLDELLAADPAQAARDRIGAALYRMYIGTLYRHGMFNADPHPGNLLFAPDGRVVVLDYGCVRHFDAATVEQLIELSAAVRRDDTAAMRGALVRLGARDPGPGKRFEPTAELLRAFYAPVREPGARRVQAGVSLGARGVLASKRSMARLHLPGKLLFLFRIRFGLYAVLSRLGAQLDWHALEIEHAGR